MIASIKISVAGSTYQALQLGPMGWILSKIRVFNIGVTICLLVPCLALTSYAAEEGPEAVIQLFYKALREGTYAEAKTHLSIESQEHIKNYAKNWVAIADTVSANGTLHAVEVGEVTKLSSSLVKGEAVICSVSARFADGSAQKLRIGLFKEGGVWKIFWIGKLKVEHAFRDYVIGIYFQPYRFSNYSSYFEIMRRGHRVMSEVTISGGSFSLSHYSDGGREIVVPIGKDITGDGEPNLVVVEYSGGSQCCVDYYIFEIGQEFRKIASVEGDYGWVVKFLDVDGDSKLEIVMRDWLFADALESFAHSPVREVILRYQGGAYRVASDLMHKPPPSHEYLEGRAQEAQEDTSWGVRNAWPDVPASLLNTMLELLYTGHPDLAWEFLEMAWPQNIPDKDDWASDFRATLEESQFWPLDSKRAYFVP